MSQDSMVIANDTGANVRTKINSAIAALVSNGSGATAPATTYAYMFWADTTNGVLKQRNAANTAWIVRGPLSEILVPARSSNTILGNSDHKRKIIATGSWTQTFTAAATLGDGWEVEFRNDGSGTITLDPNASELIDGVTTLALSPGQSCKITCDGTAFHTIGLQAVSDRVGNVITHAGTTAPAHTLALPTSASNLTVSLYPQLAAKLGIKWGYGATTAAGAFSVGTEYVIVSLGTTDFTLIGAASNTVGTVFTATGAGAGTGTASTQFGLPYVVADGAILQANGNVGTTTLGQVMSHNHFIGYWAGGGSSNGWPGAQPTGGQYSGSTGGSQNTAAGSRFMLCIYYE